jgi:hypothetical protein
MESWQTALFLNVVEIILGVIIGIFISELLGAFLVAIGFVILTLLLFPEIFNPGLKGRMT